MATTVAAIAKAAVDAVQLAITDAIAVASVSYKTKGAYSPSTGTYSETTTISNDGRGVLDTVKPIKDVFPSYTIGPSDKLVLLEGFSVVPEEGWSLELDEVGYEIKQVQDIALAGSLFYVIAIKTAGEVITADYVLSDYVLSDYVVSA